jgi:hypothetical protein
MMTRTATRPLWRRRLAPVLTGALVLLAVALAPNAHAIEIEVDPGEVGNLVTSPLNFATVPLSPLIVDLVFADSKTLTWGPGILTFAITATPSGGASVLSGYLFGDDPSTPIEGTNFDGRIEGGVIDLDLLAETVWRGMHFEAFFQNDFVYSLIWTSRPTVGEDTTPVDEQSWAQIKSYYRGE